jgi:hypothetical protein
LRWARKQISRAAASGCGLGTRSRVEGDTADLL